MSAGIRIWQILLGAALLLSWEGAAGAGLLDRFFFSRPSEILIRVWQWSSSGEIWEHLAVTFTEALLSFAVGAFLGVLFGFLLARVPLLAARLDPSIKIANAF